VIEEYAEFSPADYENFVSDMTEIAEAGFVCRIFYTRDQDPPYQASIPDVTVEYEYAEESPERPYDAPVTVTEEIEEDEEESERTLETAVEEESERLLPPDEFENHEESPLEDVHDDNGNASL
jgi:hypothetical protein